MGLLSFLRDERVVLVGIAGLSAGLVTLILQMLTDYRDDVEIKPTPPKTQYITQDTEDALEQSTLKTLLGHYNFAIRETAAKIICDRAINDDDTVTQLLYGITRPDYEHRVKCLSALAMITDTHTLQIIHTPKAYTAFVRCLELSICPTAPAYADPLGDDLWDEFSLRDAAEKLCLQFILQLAKRYSCHELLDARFVEKWLALQNWGAGPGNGYLTVKAGKETPKADEAKADQDQSAGGGNGDDKGDADADADADAVIAERHRRFHMYMRLRRNRLKDICDRLLESTAGRASLERANLLPPDSAGLRAPYCPVYIHGDGGDDGVQFDAAFTGEDTVIVVQRGVATASQASFAPSGEGGGLQPRVVEQSPEELRLRRQHREAMVLNDGTHPFARNDIIERNHSR